MMIGVDYHPSFQQIAFLGGRNWRIQRSDQKNDRSRRQQLYNRNGFTQSPGSPALWSRPLTSPLAIPQHVFLIASDEPSS
jgi:hypothetical protein